MIKILFTLFILPTVLFATRGFINGGFAATNFTFNKSHATLQTTDATQTLALTLTLPSDGDTWLVTTTCHGFGANVETFKKSVSVTRTAGVTAANGSAVNNHLQPGVDYDMIYDTTGADADLRVLVTGAVADTVNWKCNHFQESLN